MIQFEVFSPRQIAKFEAMAAVLFRCNWTMKLLLALCAVWVLVLCICKAKHRNLPSLSVDRANFCLYCFFLVQMLLINRSKQSAGVIQWNLFQWVENGILHESRVVTAVLNVLIFIPFGCLCLKLFSHGKRALSLKRLVGITAAVSFGVQLLQCLTGRGAFSMEDIINACIGASVAFWCFRKWGKRPENKEK